jgi:hypothetical protein
MAITNLENVKTILGITSSVTDSYITALIPMVEADYLLIRNKPFDLDTDGITVIYPLGSEMTAIRMIAYLLSLKENGNMGEGVQSESISRYSVTYSDKSSEYGYPKSITGMIQRFVRFH